MARFADRVGNGGIAHIITQPDGTGHRLAVEPQPIAWPNFDGVPSITKDAISAYVYAVLHDPLLPLKICAEPLARVSTCSLLF